MSPIDCLTVSEKLLAILWGIFGFFASLILSILSAFLGDGWQFVSFVVSFSAYCFVSFSFREEYPLLDKIYHLIRFGFGDAESRGAILRWCIEREVIRGWEMTLGRSRCAVNLENICEYMYKKYGLDFSDIDEMNTNFARKNLSKRYARKILRKMSEAVEGEMY